MPNCWHLNSSIALEQSRNTWVIHNSVVSTAAPFSSIEWRFANTQVQIVNNLVSHNLRERDGNPEEVLAGNLAGASPGWFRSIAQGDLHLVDEALPPVDAGAAVAAGLADRDIDLAARPAARDIGAEAGELDVERSGPGHRDREMGDSLLISLAAPRGRRETGGGVDCHLSFRARPGPTAMCRRSRSRPRRCTRPDG